MTENEGLLSVPRSRSIGLQDGFRHVLAHLRGLERPLGCILLQRNWFRNQKSGPRRYRGLAVSRILRRYRLQQSPKQCRLEGRLCPRRVAIRGWPDISSSTFEAENVLGELALLLLIGNDADHMQCDSSLECHRQFGFYLPGSKLCKKMTRAQRVVRFLQAVRESTPVLTVLVLVLLPSTVLTFEGITSSTAVSEEAAIWLQVTFPLSLLARKFNTHVVFGHLSLQRAFNTYSNDIWCAPCESVHSFSCSPFSIKAVAIAAHGYRFSKPLLTNRSDQAYRIIPQLLCPSLNARTSRSTGSILASKRESQPLPYRLFDFDPAIFLFYIVYASIPLSWRLWALVFPTSLATADTSVVPLASATVALLDCIHKMLVPLKYLLFLPSCPKREDLLETDLNGVRRPKYGDTTEARQIWSWRDFCELCIIVLCISR